MLDHGLSFEEFVRARTASLLLLLILALCFAAGGYQIYRTWAEHQGVPGPHETPPLGLPGAPDTARQRIKLGS
jgi:hypothetical protein